MFTVIEKKVDCAILRGSKNSGMWDLAGERGSVGQVLGKYQPKAFSPCFLLLMYSKVNKWHPPSQALATMTFCSNK